MYLIFLNFRQHQVLLRFVVKFYYTKYVNNLALELLQNRAFIFLMKIRQSVIWREMFTTVVSVIIWWSSIFKDIASQYISMLASNKFSIRGKNVNSSPTKWISYPCKQRLLTIFILHMCMRNSYLVYNTRPFSSKFLCALSLSDYNKKEFQTVLINNSKKENLNTIRTVLLQRYIETNLTSTLICGKPKQPKATWY
jgi:hypothetical protein